MRNVPYSTDSTVPAAAGELIAHALQMNKFESKTPLAISSFTSREQAVMTYYHQQYRAYVDYTFADGGDYHPASVAFRVMRCSSMLKRSDVKSGAVPALGSARLTSVIDAGQ